MTSDQIREALKRQPFRPFLLRTSGGQDFRIDHPELAVLSPSGRTIYVFVTPDAAAIVDVLLIESIHELPEEENRRRSA